MPINRLVFIGDPALWERSRTIRDPRAPEITELETRLSETLDAIRVSHPEIVSLAAPQIGEAVRMCRLVATEGGGALTLINPWVAEASLEATDQWEHCASIPELGFGIRRFLRVTIEYVDLTGSGRSLTAEGATAALLQHEIDHFNGFLMTDRLNDPHLIVHRRSASNGKPHDKTAGLGKAPSPIC